MSMFRYMIVPQLPYLETLLINHIPLQNKVEGYAIKLSGLHLQTYWYINPHGHSERKQLL
jgi:hypothetical protein